jgi:hypothetical protein
MKDDQLTEHALTDDQRRLLERLKRFGELFFDYADLLDRKLSKRIEALEDELDYLRQCERDRREREIGPELDRLAFERARAEMERLDEEHDS